MITSYLAGTTADFQYTLTYPDGNSVQLFHTYEQQHMADCLGLFVLCRKVLLIAALCMLLLVCAALLLHDRKRVCQGVLIGALTMLLTVTVIGIWAALDFSGLFILFHQLSFSNGLWMLNPATDLLIRLMPLSFFMHYVTLIAVSWIAALVLMGLISLHILRKTAPKRA